MAELEVAEDAEEEDGTVLVAADVVANDNGACSVMLGGWKAMASDDSVRKI